MAVRELFAGLDRVEAILSKQRYLTGTQLTEADVRLYTTLVRFDKVYVGHFKVVKYHTLQGRDNLVQNLVWVNVGSTLRSDKISVCKITQRMHYRYNV